MINNKAGNNILQELVARHPGVSMYEIRVSVCMRPGCHTYRDPGVVQTSLAKRESLSFDKKKILLQYKQKSAASFRFRPLIKHFPNRIFFK